jgi:hypothetical protein
MFFLIWLSAGRWFIRPFEQPGSKRQMPPRAGPGYPASELVTPSERSLTNRLIFMEKL